mmetsp:Transcript_33053/g.54042  ORF Transcript_33053/g.54042 Transcript_33053/m.54042 type:complete len:98 (-) Transcript_33053:1004-1297(-)
MCFDERRCCNKQSSYSYCYMFCFRTKDAHTGKWSDGSDVFGQATSDIVSNTAAGISDELQYIRSYRARKTSFTGRGSPNESRSHAIDQNFPCLNSSR